MLEKKSKLWILFEVYDTSSLIRTTNPQIVDQIALSSVIQIDTQDSNFEYQNNKLLPKSRVTCLIL